MVTSAYNFRGKLRYLERSTPGRDAMIHTGDQRTMRRILTTAPLEDYDWKIYQKSIFMFGDAAPDTDHQLLAGEGSGSLI